MAKQIINVGSLANDKTGDALRTAFGKTNANFTELYDSVAAGNTGAIRFEGIAIVGDTSDLPQGSIELVPNDGTIPTGQPNEGDLYTSWGQYLRIYPTWNADTPHIHIAAGTGENSEGDIFLGNDNKYVQVNHNGTISIGNSIGEWKFYDAEGMSVLELPNNNITRPDAEIIHREADLNIRTTRTSFGIDADIGIYSADDLWLTAAGDEVEITAANDIRIYAANSEMDNNGYSVTSGTWAGTTLTFTAQDALLVEKMSQYFSNTYSLWFEIQDGESTRWIETYTTSNVNATEGEFPIYTAEVNQNNTAATYTVLSVKTRDPNYYGSKQWAFERDGKLSLPMGGAIEPVGMGWTGLTNGTVGTPVSVVAKNTSGNYRASVDVYNSESYGTAQINTTFVPGIPNTGNYTAASSTGSWDANPVTNLGTTGGTGNGLTVDVNQSGSGYADDVTVVNPGSGYLDGETITVTSGSSSATFVITVQEYYHNWAFDEFGVTTLPGSIKGRVKANTYVDATIELDVKATINKLTPQPSNGGSQYYLADGIEGQIMYIAMATGGETSAEYTSMLFDNARYTNGNGIVTEQTTVNWWLPFAGGGTNSGSTILTLAFIDGHWNLPHNWFD